jgi:hypothetical protein
MQESTKRNERVRYEDESLGCAKKQDAERIIMQAVVAIVFIVLAIIFAIAGIAKGQGPPPEPNVPYTYDPNQCSGPILDWGICEPNVTVFYNLRFHTQSGRPARALDVTISADPDIDVLVHYYGMKKDPNGPGWFHEWTFAYTPASEGVHHLNCTAQYGPRSSTPAWLIPAGPKESDTRTILLNAVAGDIPYLAPGVTPVPISALDRISHMYQVARAKGFPVVEGDRRGDGGRAMPHLMGKLK